MSDILPYLQKPSKYVFDGTKLIFHQDRLQAFLDGTRIAPITIDMGISKWCNIKCLYCYGIKQKPSNEYIPKDKLLLLAQDAADIGVKSLAVIGDGEPTMNSGLYPFVQEGKRCGLDMAVATNGIMLDKKQIKILAESLVWLRFNISAVGNDYTRIHQTKQTHVFARVVSNVKMAVEFAKDTGCTVGLQMVLVPQCFDQIIPLAEIAVEWGVDYLVIKQFSDPGEGMPMHFDMEEYEKVKEALMLAEQMSNEKTRVVIKWAAMRDSTNITTYRKWDFERCIDLPFIFQISGNGKCYPCGYLFGDERYCYGDLRQERLKDIIAGDRYWKIVEKVRNTPLKELCTGQCRHCESLKFMDRLVKEYAQNHNLQMSLEHMCGGKQAYKRVVTNKPDHINFI